MKRLIWFVSMALVAAMVISATFVHSVFSQGGSGKTRVMVQFKAGQRAGAEKALKAAGAEFHYAFDNLDTFAVTLPTQALDGIAHNPNVVLVEEDVLRYPIGVQQSAAAVTLPDNEQTVPYGIDMVQARDVWDVNRDGAVDSGASTGANRLVCIIDSGLYTGHEDLSGLNVVGGYTTITGGYASDGSGHGTHVAGTIGARNNTWGVVGVTPGTVNLYIVRVFGDDGAWAYASTLVDAANRCGSAGANIISMSLGGSRSSSTEKRAFDSLYAAGVLPIAAAGNEGTTAVSYPAGYASVVSVAAIDENKMVADFSQKNTDVELAAPGVSVLSTVPYIDTSILTVAGVTYSGAHIEYSARGTVSGALVDGGLCTTTGSWSGKVVLCQRGDISFYDKVMNVQNSGGAAAVIYNNVPGGFLGTLGEGYSSTIVALSLSQEDGLYLVANKLGVAGVVESSIEYNVSGYEYYDGTSMATPHVSAVAALVWGADPTATNAEIRAALAATAEDLGAAGRDVYYGYGLVQAFDAIEYLVGSGGGETVSVHVVDLNGTRTVARNKWTATVTVTVGDETGAAVSGAVVNGTWSTGATTTCTTGTTGTCSFPSLSLKLTVPSVTLTVNNISGTGLTYDPSANVESAITIVK